MALYRYVKAKPKLGKKRSNLLPVFFFIAGVILLANVILPILLYQLRSQANFSQPILIPVSETKAVDYSKPSNWFPSAPKLPPRPSKITHYTLSIPKLKIKEGVVEIGGDDLMKSLIQYPGTALPGQYGNTVIFGHSVLSQFFNPQDYKTIFSTLPTLEEKDEILISFDGILYRYQVERMFEVDPSDVSILKQRYDGHYLTLVTCVPPGTYLRRLVVKARLVEI